MCKHLLYILTGISFLISCAQHDNRSGKTDLQVNGEFITLTEEQTQILGIEFVKLESMEISDVVTANGFLEVPPRYHAMISSNISGKVTKINYLIGNYVTKGSEIIRIESIEFLEMQKNYSIIKSNLKYLEDDYLRQKTLTEQNVNARKVFLQAERDYLSAKAELTAMNEKLDLLKVDRKEIEEGKTTPYLSIRTPISGYVTRIHTVMGSFIDDEDMLAEIINPEHLHAEINVYERDIIKIKIGQPVEVRIPQIEGLRIMGEVFLIDRELDEDARTATVHVHIPENENLYSGMYVEGNVILDEKKVPAIPVRGLVREESGSFVYFLKENNGENYTLKKEAVEVDFENQGRVAIRFDNRVDTTQMLAVGGVYYLSSGSK